MAPLGLDQDRGHARPHRSQTEQADTDRHGLATPNR
jgi:hypothetical protein